MGIFIANSPNGEYLGTKHWFELEDSFNETLVEELNGKLEMSFSVSRNHPMLPWIRIDSYCGMEQGKLTDRGVFIVYDIQKGIRDVTVRARSYIYTLRNAIVAPFVATSIQDAFTKLQANMMTQAPAQAYVFDCNVVDNRAFSFAKPTTAWALVGEIIKFYGVESQFVSTLVRIRTQIGETIIQPIEYGTNLTEFDLKTNDAEIYTSVIAYWADKENNYTWGTLQDCPNIATFKIKRILSLDCSKEFEQQPTQAELDQAANDYIAAAGIGIRTYNLKANFQPEQGSKLDSLHLGDRVTVRHAEYGYEEQQKVVSLTWNIRTEHVTQAQLGKIGETASGIMANQSASITELDNNRFSAAPVCLAATTSTSPTEIDMTPGYVEENFHTFVLVVRNNIRVLASTTIARHEIADTTTSQYGNDTNFDAYSNLTEFGGVYAAVKFDLANWRCKMRVSNGTYEAVLYGVR